MSSDEDVSPPPSPGIDEVEEADEDTLRILVSTDNHLGYCERDPVRGLDSFAAFEEVLSLAKQKKCDMVLIAGDLFHDNKPSRRTLHKTMEIIRRYCMGPDPVQFRILSDQATNFRSVHGTVNYEDEYYSVDLPIFSIHGNHDDPTRDGGTEMLAALDLLAVSNLLNYFGRQDEVDNVEVSPVLIQKGSTRVALYGMGSMRDERLNRMWQGKKVRFLRPENAADEPEDEEDEEEDEEEKKSWFNIFALHQNRDLGRGAKNCVHESMIPEWMDLVVWGHEHECRIECDESMVGTFRITQPGSSVATSLTGGEAVRKHVGLLEVRGKAFRLQPIPLTQVRSFVIGDLSLQDDAEEELLDPEDPNVDLKVTKLLEDKVKVLVFQAKEQFKETHDAARAAGNPSADQSARNLYPLKYKLEKPNEVLVRLKVDHTGFSTLNNQRFGAKFVSKVANPSDILLFHRRKQESEKSSGGKSRSKKRSGALDQPIEPEELEEMHVEDLVKENLESADKKLELLDEQRLGLALEEFVAKEQSRAINEAMSDMLEKQQKKLIKRGRASEAENEDGDRRHKVTTATSVREFYQEESEKNYQEHNLKEEEQDQMAGTSSKRRRKNAKASNDDDLGNKENLSLSEDDMEVAPVAKKRANKSSAKTKTSRAKSGSSQRVADEEEESAVKSSRSRARPRREAAKSHGKYNVDDNDSEDVAEESDAVISIPDDDDDDDMLDLEEDEEVRPKKRARAPASSRKKTPAKQAKLSFVESKRSTKKAASRTTSRKTGKRSVVYELSDSDGDDERGGSHSLGMSKGWGSVDTHTAPSQSRRR